MIAKKKPYTIMIKRRAGDQSFPLLTAVLYSILMLAAPFVSPYLLVGCFIIQCCRLIRYDFQVSTVDLAYTIPFASFYRIPGGIAFIVFYVLLFDAVFFLKRPRVRLTASFVLVVTSCLYFLMRTGRGLSAWVFMCGGLLLLYLMFSNQDITNQEPVLKAFITGVVVSSVYAYLFRNNSSVLAYLYDASAVFDGRFRGLFPDPNYYTTFLTLAMVALMILNMNGKIRRLYYFVSLGIIIFVGSLTISKSFFLMLAFIVTYHTAALLSQKHYARGFFLLLVLMGLVVLLLQGQITVFDAVLDRFLASDSINSLTTGRTKAWQVYWDHISARINVLFFGAGLDAPLLMSKGTHNAFLEAIYNTGFIGLVLLLLNFTTILRDIRREIDAGKNKTMMRFLPLFVVAMQYFFLQGISSMLFYISLYIMYSCYIQCMWPDE